MIKAKSLVFCPHKQCLQWPLVSGYTLRGFAINLHTKRGNCRLLKTSEYTDQGPQCW